MDICSLLQVRQVLALALRRWGCSVCCVSTDSQAISKLKLRGGHPVQALDLQRWVCSPDGLTLQHRLLQLSLPLESMTANCVGCEAIFCFQCCSTPCHAQEIMLCSMSDSSKSSLAERIQRQHMCQPHIQSTVPLAASVAEDAVLPHSTHHHSHHDAKSRMQLAHSQPMDWSECTVDSPYDVVIMDKQQFTLLRALLQVGCAC